MIITVINIFILLPLLNKDAIKHSIFECKAVPKDEIAVPVILTSSIQILLFFGSINTFGGEEVIFDRILAWEIRQDIIW